MITKLQYIDANELCVEIRRAGGWAYVELENDKEIILTNRSLRWLNNLCQKLNWIGISKTETALWRF